MFTHKVREYSIRMFPPSAHGFTGIVYTIAEMGQSVVLVLCPSATYTRRPPYIAADVIKSDHIPESEHLTYP